MTNVIFDSILIIGAVTVFCAVSFPMLVLFDGDNIGFAIGTVAAVLFIVIFVSCTPSSEQMIENDYHAMMEDRPKCIDNGDTSLGCKKDYIDWQKDSIEKQHKYDSVKVKLENLMIKTDTIRVTVIKNDAHKSDSVKTCIEQCWNLIPNSDIKQCQDECFK